MGVLERGRRLLGVIARIGHRQRAAALDDLVQVANLGLVSFVKTSGSKGIHLHVPLNGTATFEASRPFAKAVAETFEARFPDEVVSRQTKTKRTGRVGYVCADAIVDRAGVTAAAAVSCRNVRRDGLMAVSCFRET